MIQSYAMIATQTKLTVLNNLGESMPFNQIIRTNVRPKANDELMNLLDEWDTTDEWKKPFSDNIIAILGRQKFKQLVEFSANLPKVKIRGYMTRTVLSGSANGPKMTREGTFSFLNCRPIDMPRKMRMLLGEMYKQYNPTASVIVLWNILVEENNYDINVSPDKREVFIKNESEMLEALRIELTQFFEEIQRVKAYDVSDRTLNQFAKPVEAMALKQLKKLDFQPLTDAEQKKQGFEEVQMTDSQFEQANPQKRMPDEIDDSV